MHTMRKDARAAAEAKMKRMLGRANGGAVSYTEGLGPTRPRNRPNQPDHAIDGVKASKRLDRPAYAKGGRVKNGKTNVNVIVAPAVPQPAAPAVIAAPPPPPAPTPPPQPAPIAMGPAAQMGGMAGGLPGMKRGGRAYARGGKVKMDAGAGSGEGRLEKIDMQERAGK